MANNERIEDLLIEFDELDMQPMLIVPDPMGRAKEWKHELTYAIKHLKSEVAREIFGEIESVMYQKFHINHSVILIDKADYTELKKKYIGDKR